jgi:hypothetical protein
LLKVEVDLLTGAEVLATRVVDFHDNTTINKKRSNSDKKIYKNDIGVEGYQKFPMNDPKRTRTDLRNGVLVRNLPDECDTLIAVFSMSAVTSLPVRRFLFRIKRPRMSSSTSRTARCHPQAGNA